MIIIPRDSTDPYFNLATEEFVFNHFSEDVIMLWINDPSIIIGKHQNALAEINLDFTLQNDIPVIRRITGGGTVYHDSGNLNYTFIRRGRKDRLVDYERHTRPIIDALSALSVKAKLEGKSNLTIGGLKFSGNAEHVFKDRVIHHGTMLFDADLDMLDMSLRLKHNDYLDKAVRSIRSKVTNIIEHLPEPMSIMEFRDYLTNYFMVQNPELRLYELSEEENSNIRFLAEDKYKSWEWNFGYSPKYRLEKPIKLGGEIMHLYLETKQGIIKRFYIKNKNGVYELGNLQKLLVGVKHEKNAIRNTLNSIKFATPLKNIDTEEFIRIIF